MFSDIDKLYENITTDEQTKDELNRIFQFKYCMDKTVPFSTTDPSGIITYANKKFEELSGYSKEELVGSNHNIVRHPDMPKQVFADLWSTIKSGKIWEGIVKNRKKDGNSYYVKAHVMPMFDRNGNISEFISYREDVTVEEKRREKLEGHINLISIDSMETKARLKQYEEALDLSSAVFRFDMNMFVTYANRSFKNLYKKDPVGKQIDSIFGLAFYKEYSKKFFKTLTKKKKWYGTTSGVADDGEMFYTETTITPILNTSGKVVEYMCTMNDFTEVMTAKQEIADTQKDIIFTMGALGEARSQETGNHVRRVAYYSKKLALQYGISEGNAEKLRMASPMHDIGKIAIPDSILNKPGKLTEEEFKLMKTHTTIGCDILKSSNKELLQIASIIAGEHHEKFDGTGYPKGLKGNDIHIYGRITALADVFDALGSDRVYKKAWDMDKVLDFIQEQKGKHFDPKLVDIFFDNLDEFLAIKKQFSDI
ncbi:MAG: PAS domain S-box protein [Campylobacterales bacterium]|nr:PAS domain S-box protein [Campylobacterales bacterium]